eukprot:scaffold447_cov307-Pinguiococcus_pyrenoidosus.AAC.52
MPPDCQSCRPHSSGAATCRYRSARAAAPVSLSSLWRASWRRLATGASPGGGRGVRVRSRLHAPASHLPSAATRPARQSPTPLLGSIAGGPEAAADARPTASNPATLGPRPFRPSQHVLLKPAASPRRPWLLPSLARFSPWPTTPKAAARRLAGSR